MHRAVVRRMALVTIAVSSVLWALFLVFSITARDQINGLTTPHLLAILALLLLPGATWLTWRLERSLHKPGAPPASQAPAPPIGTDQSGARRNIHGGPGAGREAAASHRRDSRPGRSRTP